MKDAATVIIAFAGQLADPRKDARSKALERSWIDTAGRPTPDGLALHAALMDQAETRSTLRNIV